MANEETIKDEPVRESDRGIRTYVLRAGRMTDGQKKAIQELGPKYCLPFEAGKRIDLDAAFGREPGSPARPLIVEIGFGMGTATWQIAAARPDLDYLGIEVHTPGVGKLMTHLETHGVKNVRIIHHDAIEVFEGGLAPDSLAGIHIFYPDPWPKKRHQKRRLLRPGLVELLVSRLAPGGYLYFVTDIESYAESSLELLSHTEGLFNRYESFAARQEWRPETKFEARALRDGRGAWELLFEKR
jgi:tRNA (guanine-N7-)-methyltransferase